MGYLHIENLFSNQDICLFKVCYAMEKIHGTSAHVSLKSGQIHFHSGGESNDRFVKLFPADLKDKMELYGYDVVVYGECYGSKCQGMKDTYGNELRFIVFDMQISGVWLTVPEAEAMAKNLGLEFVYYEMVNTDFASLNAQRDADSIQAIRNGMGPGKKREGVVLRPFIEVTKADGSRVICKHKRDDFRETATPRKLGAPIEVLSEANAIATEWVTTMRLQHVLDKIPGHNINMMGKILAAMQEDVLREGKGEIVDSKEARKAISNKTVAMYKEYSKNNYR
jgi:hypothetical protein